MKKPTAEEISILHTNVMLFVKKHFGDANFRAAQTELAMRMMIGIAITDAITDHKDNPGEAIASIRRLMDNVSDDAVDAYNEYKDSIVMIAKELQCKH